MSSEREISIIQKATIYDLMKIFRENPDKAYTLEDLQAITDAYLAGTES